MEKIFKMTTIILSMSIIFYLIHKLSHFSERSIKYDKIHLNEYPPARDPLTGADSSLIESLNFFVEENIRLENYILILKKKNQILDSCCNLSK